MGILTRLADSMYGVFLPSSRRGRAYRVDKQLRKARDAYLAGRYEQADQGFEECVSIAEGFGESSLRLADSLEQVAEFLHSAGIYAKAEALMQRALPIREKRFGPDSPQVIRSLNELALLHYAQGRYPEGEVLYQRLIPILEAEFGAGSREVAICLDNYAALLRKQKRMDEASQLLDRAKEIRRNLANAVKPSRVRT